MPHARLWCSVLFATLLAVTPSIVMAQEEVDVELVLAVDVSLSMSPDELELQRRGYAEALTHDTVIQAIQDGLNGRIAIAYFEWAGDFSQQVVIPWTTISSREDAARVVEKLSINPPSSARRTSISGAMNFAADLFAESEYQSPRRVLDISGDGPNNQGPPVIDARDKLVATGVTINGLPLITSDGTTTRYDIDNLEEYYSHCVIGGPSSFMIPVNEWPQFAEAVRRKLVIELAGQPTTISRPPVLPVQLNTTDYDCMVGEKMWQERIWMWRDG